MKKSICLVLVLLMAVSMAACQSAPEAVNVTEAIETSAPQEQTVEAAPLIDLESIVDQKLQANNAVTETFDTHAEYENLIHTMGFFEYQGMRYRFNGGANIQRILPKEITYDGENFRFVFDYIMFDEDTKEDFLTENWILYGTTSDTMADISGAPEEGLVDQSMFDFCVFDDYNDNYQMRNYDYFYSNAFVTSQAKYYGESQHLYSLVKIYGSQSEQARVRMAPRVLGDESFAPLMKQEFELKKPVSYETVAGEGGHLMEVGEFTLHWGGREERFQFRRGMTLADWASSSLNTGSWMAGPEGSIYSYTYDYMVPNSCLDIEQLLTDGSHIYASENNPNMTGKTIDPGMVNSIMTAAPPNVAYAHLVNWQTPLLASGICITDEGQTPSTYGMFDISTVTARDASVSVYIQGIDAGMFADMELYVVKDYEPIVSVLREYGINRHTAPLSMEAAQSALADNAIQIPFDTANDLTAATFNPEDHNFLLDKATAFVITYQGAIVYWIHMPAIN